jgi:hypothetical protein
MSQPQITTTFSNAMMIALMVLLTGCREIPRPADPLVIPPAEEIEAISVTRSKSNGDWDAEWQIDNRQRIEEIVAQLRSNNTGYYSARDNRSPQEYAVALNGYERMKSEILVGADWLAGVDDSHKDKQGRLIYRYRKALSCRSREAARVGTRVS